MISADEAAHLMRRAVALQEQGLHREALELYAGIAEAFPNHPDVLHNSGLARFALGDCEAAEAFLLSALKARPGFAKAQSNLVKLWTKMDRAGTLAEIAADARWVAVLDFEASLALGQHLRHHGEYQNAFLLANRCVGVNPGDAVARHLLGVTLDRLSRPDEAMPHLREALRLAPDDPLMLADLSRCLFSMHMRSKRPECMAEGRSLLERAGKLAPKNAAIQHQMGVVLEESGDFEGAKQAYRRALDAVPDHLPALASIASLSRDAVPQVLMDDLDRALSDPNGRFPPSERSRAHQVLGKCHDAHGAFDRAFAHFRHSNALASHPTRYDRQRQQAYARNLAQTYPAAVPPGPGPSAAQPCRPVFIIGMPRSGTTLLEHALSRHPEVTGAGELPYFSAIERAGMSLHDSDGRRASHQEDMPIRLKTDYDALLRSVDPDVRYVIDKMPFNFWQLGAIFTLYPGAKVLHCTRDPYDIGLSCYIESFSDFHPWSLDLADIGHYYRQYQYIMGHWRNVYGDRILELAYDRLVTDHAQLIRETLTFLGLGWQDRVGTGAPPPHPERMIQTPSNWQVRQPIYRSSLDRWKHYERHLAPLFEAIPRQDSLSA